MDTFSSAATYEGPDITKVSAQTISSRRRSAAAQQEPTKAEASQASLSKALFALAVTH